MSVVISIANEKGGVAKTTTAAALASLFAASEYKVIIIDLDKQADLSMSLKVSNENIDIYDILLKKKGIKAEKVNDNLVIIPGSYKMRNLERHLNDEFPRTRHEEALKEVTEELKKRADLIFLDCPPDIDSMIVENAFVASDFVLIPTDPHPFGIAGIESVLDMIKEINQVFNPKLQALGIAITRFRTNTNLHDDLVEDIRNRYKDLVFKAKIRENITVQEVTTTGNEFAYYDEIKNEISAVKIKKHSHGYLDYSELAVEISERLNKSIKPQRK
jgi:chromosome partitioning protein